MIAGIIKLNLKGSSGENSFDELFIVEAIFLVHFQLFKKLIQLIFAQLFSKVGHHISKLLYRNSGPFRFEN